MTPPRHEPGRHNGFSLIELIVVIVVLALMVPTTLSMVADATRGRHAAARASTATTFAASVAEHIIADMHAGSPAIGFNALEDPEAYLNDPQTGLRHRLAWLIEHHASMGYSLGLTIGPPISADGSATGDPSRDRYRRLRIAISYADPVASTREYTLVLLVGDESA